MRKLCKYAMHYNPVFNENKNVWFWDYLNSSGIEHYKKIKVFQRQKGLLVDIMCKTWHIHDEEVEKKGLLVGIIWKTRHISIMKRGKGSFATSFAHVSLLSSIQESRYWKQQGGKICKCERKLCRKTCYFEYLKNKEVGKRV